MQKRSGGDPISCISSIPSITSISRIPLLHHTIILRMCVLEVCISGGGGEDGDGEGEMSPTPSLHYQGMDTISPSSTTPYHHPKDVHMGKEGSRVQGEIPSPASLHSIPTSLTSSIPNISTPREGEGMYMERMETEKGRSHLLHCIHPHHHPLHLHDTILLIPPHQEREYWKRGRRRRRRRGWVVSGVVWGTQEEYTGAPQHLIPCYTQGTYCWLILLAL